MKKPLSEEQKARRKAYAIEYRKKYPEKAREYARRSRNKNKERVRAYQKSWVEKNKVYLKGKQRDYYAKYKNTQRDKYLVANFGITLEKYNQMVAEQGGVCSLCGENPGVRRLAVDHDHETGRVRALLCRGCNVGIGNLKDDPLLLERAAEYVRRHRR